MTVPSSGNPVWYRWREVDSLFGRLLELAAREREIRLVEWCAGDAELERTLRELLAAEGGDSTLDRRSLRTLVEAAIAGSGRGDAGKPSGDDDESATPSHIGPYRILRLLGRGGMASVYLARRDDPDFPQHVALKVLRPEFETEDLAQRFRTERRILAVLRHPSIARVFDAGSTDDGRLYLVMEYVEGRNLLAHCDTKRMDPHSRLRLFMAVTRAVSHAHEQGIVHGDLKPSNILITEEEEHTRLLDFGIATLLDGPSGEDQGRSASGAASWWPMTPEFASPEQRLGHPLTERSDVYQLGLILYELLAGSRYPVAGRSLSDGAPANPAQPAPSKAVASEAAAARGMDRKGLMRSLKGDLDAIVMRALQPEPGHRYASVGEFHDEIARYLESRAAMARSGSGARRTRRRWAIGTSFAATAALAAVLLLGLSSSRSDPAVPAPAPRVAHWFAMGPVSQLPGAGEPGLALQVSELLATNLARLPAVQVLALQRWAGMEEPDGSSELKEVAQLAGAEELLLGTLEVADDDQLGLALVRVDLASGLTTASYRAEAATPFELVDRITGVLLSDLGYTPPSVGVASVTTSSPAAYRMYQEGLRFYYGGDSRAALQLFGAALEADPGFAMAAYRRALTNEKVDHAAFRDDLIHATSLAGHASERERLLIRNAWALVMDDPVQTILADSLVMLFPAEPEGHLFVGLARTARGEFMEAVPELELALSMSLALSGMDDPDCIACGALEGLVTVNLLADSLAAAERAAREWVELQRESDRAWRALATTLEYQGLTDEALSARRLATALGSENPRDGVFAAVLALREGEFIRADTLLASHTEEDTDPLLWQNVLWYRTLSARYQGRLEEALHHATQYRETLVDAATTGHPPLWAPLLQAVILEEMDRADEAAAIWREIAAGPYEPESRSRTARHRAWTLSHAAGAHATAGEFHLLDALADTIQALGVESAYGRDPLLHEYVRGLLLASRGEDQAAAEALRRATYSLTGGYGRINLELGRLLLALGEPREAITVLGGALRGPLDAANLYVNRTEVHRLLAEAYRAAGLPDCARVHDAWVNRALGERPLMVDSAGGDRRCFNSTMAILSPGTIGRTGSPVSPPAA